MNEYVIVSFLAKPQIQLYPRNVQPLHLTVLGTFYSDMSDKEISAKLKPALDKSGSLQVRTENYEMYGRNNDVPVVTVESSKSLSELHKKVLDILGPNIKLKSPDYNGSGYHPHITDKKQLIGLNSIVSIHTLYLVQLTKETGHIKRSFSLY